MGDCCDKYGTCARITVMMFTAAGLAFSILAVQSCEFLEFGNNQKLGLFHFTDQDGNCVKYDDSLPIEGTDNAARACGSLAAIFGLIALVLIMFEFCICKLWCARCIESLVYAVAYICQACTFLVYNNAAACTNNTVNYSCSWGQGSTWSVVAFCLYVVASSIMCCTPRSKPLLCKHRESRKEEKEARQMADEDEAKDKAADAAEKGDSEPEQPAGAADSTPAAASSGDENEAAAHASAY